jgi:multiple sugar transport system substrate-binding protein
MKGYEKICFLAGLLLVVTLFTTAGAADEHPLKGRKINMTILGISGWLPSRLGVDMSPLFAEYARKHYGYEVSFTLDEAPFTTLFQKASSSFSNHSQKYNIIIVDSQWLGALAEPKWIVNVNELIKENPELKTEWYDPLVIKSYMEYPEETGAFWGLPEEGDTIALFIRKDLFHDPAEQKAFKETFGMDLPQTFEDFETLSMEDFEKIAHFFTRPEKGLYGTVMQYSKEYDYMTMFLYPFVFSTGGDIWDPKERRVYGVLNSDINARAMEWNKRMLDYQPPGADGFGISEEISAFTQNKVASALQWAALGLSMITPENRDKVMVVPPPGFRQKNGSLKRLYPVGGQPWVINAFNDSSHMRVAVDFMKWWYLPETQLEFAKRGGNPCLKAVLESPEFENIQPWFRAYKYMLKHDRSRDFWHDPKYAELLATQQEGFTAYATDKAKDARSVLEYVACKQQRILFEAKRSIIAPPASCGDARLK